MTYFATVTNVQAGGPLTPEQAVQVELRRFIATRRERHSENASRMREWAELVRYDAGEMKPLTGR